MALDRKFEDTSRSQQAACNLTKLDDIANNDPRTLRRRHRLSIFILKSAVTVFFILATPLVSSTARHFRSNTVSSKSLQSSTIEEQLAASEAHSLNDATLHSLPARGLLYQEPETEDAPVAELCGEEIDDQEDRCRYVQVFCGESEGMINYLELHYCTMENWEGLSVFVLIWVVLMSFYLLGDTAEEYFCPVVKQLTVFLDLSPNTAGVTFLALGNGAPDVFASLAAFVNGDGKIGLGAIISAGSFVAAFVVGSVAVAAAPFEIEPMPYFRDVLFYFVAACGVFAVCFQGVIHLHHSLLFVLYYLLYVAVVVCQDYWAKRSRTIRATEDLAKRKAPHPADDWAAAPPPPEGGEGGAPPQALLLEAWTMAVDQWTAFSDDLNEMPYAMVLKAAVQSPFDLLRKLTVPATGAGEWNKLSAALCTTSAPLFVLFNLRDVVDFAHPVVHVYQGWHLPLWAVAVAPCVSVGVAQFSATDALRPPKWLMPIYLAVAFVTSIAWISLLANELLGCLSALGVIMGISSSILGVTVLAWGNSIGDLVADVVIARAGQPKMAVAGCYAGPMFNMLIGLGLALTIKTISIYPSGYELHYHPNIPISFGFLFASLLGSLCAVALSGHRITKPWGICLILLYAIYMVVSVLVETHILDVGYPQ